jgi:hypothetical protein
MILVVVIIMALAGFAAPRLNYSAMRVDANVRIVRSVLQQAWRSSIQNQHDILVSFDTASRRIRTVEDVNQDGLPSAGERMTWRPLEEGARFDRPTIAGVDSVTVSTSVSGPGVRSVQSMPTIIFRRNGSTSGDVDVYLSLAYRGKKEFRAVTVTQATGRSEWFRLVNTTWWRSGGI